jgi:hypothetical protein
VGILALDQADDEAVVGTAREAEEDVEEGVDLMTEEERGVTPLRRAGDNRDMVARLYHMHPPDASPFLWVHGESAMSYPPNFTF